MSEPINDGGPAFPLTNDAISYANRDFTMQGMSLRDYFAAKAVPAIIAQGFKIGSEADLIAVGAYKMADAMLKARSAK